MDLRIATFALLPVLAIQGRYVKTHTLRLKEPDGERQGQIGQGRALSILIVGDSAAAGVGVTMQQQALLGQLLDILQTDYQIHYQLEAKSGRTSQQLIEAIKQIPLQNFDVVISSIGVNDVTRLISPKQWLQQQIRLYSMIANKFSPKLTIVASVPPMQLFKALPQPMAWLFGTYAKQMNDHLKQYAATQRNLVCLDYDLKKYQDMHFEMAEDGFHPSAQIYRFWAEQIATQIKDTFKA